MTWSHPEMLFPHRVRLSFGSLSPSKFGDDGMFIPDPGSRTEFFPSWIPDPNFFHPGSWIRIKEFKYFNQTKWFLSSQKYDLGFSYWIWILTFYPSQILFLDPRSRIQGSKRHQSPYPGSRIRIRNTGDLGFAQAVGGSIGY